MRRERTPLLLRVGRKEGRKEMRVCVRVDGVKKREGISLSVRSLVLNFQHQSVSV